jgi:branched-chain amino acid transport system substrate-binding protein
MRSTVAAVLLLLFCFCIAVQAQGTLKRAEADSLAIQGEKLLKQARWTEAAALFKDLTARFADSPDIDFYLLNRGKAEYYAANTAVALTTFDDLTKRFPESPYLASALYFGANAMYKSNQRDRAATQYVDAYSHSRDERLDHLIVSSLAGFDVAKLEARLGSATDLNVRRKCELARALAEKFVQRNRPKDAERLRGLCGQTREPSGTVPVATSTAIGEICDVAVLVPLSGEYQSFGQDLFDGAATAAAEYRKETGRQINLTPYDTKGDPIVAARLVRELVDLQVDALIGPLTSDEAEVTSATLGCHNLPLIAPAATEAGLTSLSDCSFQLSPNIALQGVQMAEYARNTLRADSAVVISSTSSDQLEMVEAFVERFQSLGGKIVATEYYRVRDRDYGSYIKDIKSILLRHTADSSTFLDDKGDTLSEEAVPAQVDCLFIPGTPEQIRLLLPQIRFYNLTGAYLGSDGWGDESVYALGDDVTRGAVFTSPFVRTARSTEYTHFAAVFSATYDRKPSRVAGLGYDAVHVLTDALKRGAASRQQLIDQLARTSGYDGAEGRVTFGTHRENIEMPLFKITGGQAVLLGIDKVSPK